MKNIYEFKKGIFKKAGKGFIFEKAIKSEAFKKNVKNLQNHLEDLIQKFPQLTIYQNEELVLAKIEFNKNVPPKTKRCFKEIFKLIKPARTKEKEYKTINIKKYLNDKELKFYLVFELYFSEATALLKKIIFFNNLSINKIKIIQNYFHQDFLKQNPNKPEIIEKILKNQNISISTLKNFLSSVSLYYKKISQYEINDKIDKIKKDQSYLLEFFSEISLNYFMKRNNIYEIEYLNNIFFHKIYVIRIKGSFMKDLNLVFRFELNLKIENSDMEKKNLLKKEKNLLTKNQTIIINKLKKSQNQNYPTIGILDCAINKNSILKPFIYEPEKDLLNNKGLSNEKSSHGDIVVFRTLIGLIDKKGEIIDDGCITPNIAFFPIVTKNITLIELMKNIKSIIEKYQDIKIWNFSMNYGSSNPYFWGVPTFLAIFFDLLMEKYKIIFIQSAGNLNPEEEENASLSPSRNSSYNKIFFNKPKVIYPPSETSLSLVVGSIEKNAEAANFNPKNINNLWNKKPDLSIWSGTDKNPAYAIFNNKIVPITGTSFSAPLVARRFCHFLYQKNNIATITEEDILWIKARLIFNAFSNNKEKKFLNRIGWGYLKEKIEPLKEQNINFVFSDKLKTSKEEFDELFIPVFEKNGKLVNLFSFIFIIVFFPELDFNYGSEYIGTGISFKLYRKSKNINARWTKVNFDESETKQIFYYKNESELMEEGKWKTVFCFSKQEKKDNSVHVEQGIYKVVLKKEKKRDKNHNIPFVIFSNLKHLNGFNKNNDFKNGNGNHLNLPIYIPHITDDLQKQLILAKTMNLTKEKIHLNYKK